MTFFRAHWWLSVSLVFYSGLLAADESSGTAAVDKALSQDHRRAIKEHVRDSNYRINLLLRSASMANIDSALDMIKAIQITNQECMKNIERCKDAEATPNTANAPHAAPLFEPLPRL
ncbi:hypothetical protein [Pseudomonas cavernicola]|uniref:hypothetical protein n=1 Tax=Pseudomonas cavernicola TaxID=2320866 RepID=UPI0011C462FB|nr:hypothetical protein [Pseudomonas cavernicola]